MQNDILELVKQLSLKDTKTLSQKVVKLSSECGELASKALAYDNAQGDRFRFITREQILDEVADNILVALSIAYSLKYESEDIFSMMKDKSIHWSQLSEQDTSDGKYPYEIHLTVLVKYLQGFVDTCNSWSDVKPILIHNYYGDNSIDSQVTTSTIVFGSLSDATTKMAELVSRLKKYGCEVFREKIETVPWHPAINTHGGIKGKYFESHASIMVNGDTELKTLIKEAKNTDLYISRNALKTADENGNIKVMGTVRTPPFVGIEEHDNIFNIVLDKFREKYNIVKCITEYAILDSNEDIDARWLGKTINII